MHHPVLCPITPQGAKFGWFTHHARNLGLITHEETPVPPCFTLCYDVTRLVQVMENMESHGI